ncbi:hypothetical protein D4Q52_06350 [Rhodopseudomonas palustris]|uniref:Uncharacterized protein n=1 Tax=Rhodopseudomonas palustris TaxID=1076 RepID=A0A418VJL9_RHOPL|nr:hypothetical protein D4Q52_06350 [Rhodopseudomonas palustris]
MAAGKVTAPRHCEEAKPTKQSSAVHCAGLLRLRLAMTEICRFVSSAASGNRRCYFAVRC